MERTLIHERSLIPDPHALCGESTIQRAFPDRVLSVESFSMIRFGIYMDLSNWECFRESDELFSFDINSIYADRTIGLLIGGHRVTWVSLWILSKHHAYPYR